MVTMDNDGSQPRNQHQDNCSHQQKQQSIATTMQPCCNFLEYSAKAKRRPEDPMSHRIIEKRRRDRMNNCLADLSRLIPSEYLKKGRGRIEKTEIIEMAIKHVKYLQSRVCANIEKNDLQYKNVHQSDSSENIEQCLNESSLPPHQTNDVSFKEGYKRGFQECLSELIHYLIEVEGYEYPGDKMLRVMNHLEHHYDRIIKGEKQICQNRIDIVSSSSSSSSVASSIRNDAGDPKFSTDVTNFLRQQQHDNDVSTASRAAVRMGIIISPPTNSYKYNDNRNDTHDHHDDCSSVTDYNNSHEKTNNYNNEDNNDNYTVDHEMTIIGQHRHESQQSRNNDNNGDDANDNSQFRKILTGLPSSHINTTTTTVFAPQARPNIIRKVPLESPPSTHHNAIIGGNDQQVAAANSLYKFKNNIKERFSAEHSTNSVITGEGCPSKRRMSTTDDNSSVHSDQTYNDHTPPPPPTVHTSVKLIRGSPTTITSHPVPIFALHSKGAFYVPLTVDSDLLNPFLNHLDADLNVNTFSSLVLHPVTISVNFQRQIMQPVKSFNSVLSSAWDA